MLYLKRTIFMSSTIRNKKLTFKQIVMENLTEKINAVNPAVSGFLKECEICHDPFFSYGEALCEKCAYKKHLMKIGYSESYADDLVKTHMRFEQELRELLTGIFTDKAYESNLKSMAISTLVKCHCNALEVGWNEGYQFARDQRREFSSNIDIPGPITPKADEIRRDSRIVICDRCEGTGKVRVYNEDPGYSGPGEEQCPICNGKGRRNLLINFVFSPIKDN